MIKTIALLALLSTQANAYSFNMPNLDFDMAERAILNSAAVRSAEADLGEEAVSVKKIGKKTYRVTFEGGCDVTAKFGKWSKVYLVEDSFFCN